LGGTKAEKPQERRSETGKEWIVDDNVQGFGRLVKRKLAMTVGEVTEVKRGRELAKGKRCDFMGGRNAFQ
jgi:hypothetical protein